MEIKNSKNLKSVKSLIVNKAMCNFRDTIDPIKDCTSCINFISYTHEYEDDLEPYDLGRCNKDVAEMVGVEMVCDLWENRIKDRQSQFDTLCDHAGLGDLKPNDRSGNKPLQRQAVWYVMRERGVAFREIAEQSHRTHGTVVVGVKRFKGYLSVNDEEAVQMYQNIIKVAQNEKE